ncbi:T9SS type B sorting domain-containing protein [Flavisolibacter ginsenosidimutans]|uniref:T9SS type B sorting domain-containing protein n=2 Tax=Flavisolibacter ginsenosidimutans TaxID=661481 RepID=A0A5B8UHV7_9BACT|nr:T9SS type B sorting domain-containing protein [Flavisolibacter ginsenosidimutans]
MENTAIMFLVNRKEKPWPFSRPLLPRLVTFFGILLFIFFSLTTNAQCIQNNVITLSQAVCAGTVGYLQGSTPTVGGNGTISYQWEANPNNCTGNGGYSPIPGAIAKDYAVPSSADPNLCYRRIVTFGNCTDNSNGIRVDIPDRTTPSPPTATVVQPNCVLATGSINVTSPAPATGITYSVNGTTYQTSNNFTGLAPGAYSVTAKFPSGCVSPTLSVSLSTPIPTGSISPSAATICSGGTQVLTLSGGNTYQWYRNGVLIPSATSSTYNATQAGTYTATIINGVCAGPATNSAVITVVPLPSGTVSPAVASICAGNSVALTATGGGTYQWFRNGSLINDATAATYIASQQGSYSVIISNGVCSAPASDTAVVTVEALPAGTITPGSASICFGSSQVLSVSGGATYQWYKDNVSIGGATASTYNAIQGGAYTVDIISGTGCRGRASNTATVSILPLPTGSISPATATVCAGSSVTLTATGGANYQWYKDGVAINNAFSSTYTATQSGRYAADIFDVSGCKGKSSNESVVTVVTTPSGLISPANSTLCPGGSVTLTATGGNSYQWYKDGVLLVGVTAATYAAIQTGNYTVDIILGTCRGSSTNTAVVTQGTAPAGSITPASASLCSGNSVVLTATGGVSYQWYKDGVLITGATTAIYTATQTGTYSVILFNGGCSAPASNTVVVAPSTSITFSIASTNPSCASSTGTITVNTPTGGSGSGYTYSKDNGVSFQTANTFTGLSAGTYQIVVKDAGGCKSNPSSVVIASFTSTLQASAATTNITCTQASGSVSVTAGGGTSPYQYSLDGGTYQSGNSFSSLSLGAHKVTVKDAGGCTFEVNFNITQVASTLAATASVTNAFCGQPNGSVTVQATGGAPGYTYSLDNGSFQTANTFGNLTAGSHKITVKDNAGCVVDVAFTITQSATVPNLVITNPPKICPNATVNLQSPTITAGSDAGLQYSYWTDANTTTAVQSPGAVSVGTYYIKATNAGGCTSIKSVQVTAQTVFPGSITATRTLACITDSLPLTASGGRAYQWYRNDTLITGATSVSYQTKQSGIYSVYIDDGTCAVKASNTVKIEFKPCTPIADARALVPTAFTPNRNGVNDVLRPIFYNVTSLHYFKVYNRWGQQVFETATPGKGWDGNKDGVPQPAETYSWILEAVGKNGEIIKASGRSVLIR